MPHNVPKSVAQSSLTETASIRFARAFSAAQLAILSRAELVNIWPLAEIFKDKTRGPMAEIREFLDPIVRNAMTKRGLDGKTDEETLLGHLLNVTDGMHSIPFFDCFQIICRERYADDRGRDTQHSVGGA